MTDKTQDYPIPSTSHLPAATFEAGQVIGGKYKIVSELGSGGMGTVYCVQQVFLHKDFALKTLKNRGVSGVLMRRFQLEAKAASLLEHGNLVQVHDFGLLGDGQPYFVMDLIDGTNLAQRLKERGSLPVDEVVAIFVQVCLGLAYAHENGVVHRDIKPSNIMLVNGAKPGTEGSVKVVDFGVAKLTSSEDGEIQALTCTGEVFGSPLYMSPEQCSGEPVDHRADVYSLGCVLFEALTGAPPHMGTNAMATMMLHQSKPAPTLRESSLGRKFPETLEQIVAKMLKKSPQDRYTNLDKVAQDLATVCSDGAILQLSLPRTVPPKPPRVVSMPVSQFFLLIGSIVFVTGIATGFGGYHLGHGQIESTSSPALAGSAANPVERGKIKDRTAELGQQEGILESLDRVSPNAKHEREMLTNFGAITSTEVTKNGVKARQFVFPRCGIGELQVYDSSKPVLVCIPARGPTIVPFGKPVTLSVDGQIYQASLEIPSIFEKIGVTEFEGLTIKINTTDESTDKNIPEILNTAAKWTRLTSLALHSIHMNNGVLDALNKIQNLSRLSLVGDSFYDATTLSLRKCSHKLEELHMDTVLGNIDGILKSIAGAPELRRVSLYHVHESAAGLEALIACPKLEYLHLYQDNLSAPMLHAISHAKTLATLHISGSKLNIAQLNILKKCPKLTTIALADKLYSPTERANLIKMDRRITFSQT